MFPINSPHHRTDRHLTNPILVSECLLGAFPVGVRAADVSDFIDSQFGLEVRLPEKHAVTTATLLAHIAQVVLALLKHALEKLKHP